MMRARGFSITATVGLSLFVSGCASSLRLNVLEDVDRVRQSSAAQQGAMRAPDIYARAEAERDAARSAHALGKDVQANLHAERALAAYEDAVVAARLAAATEGLADAERAAHEASTQEEQVDAERAKLEHQADELQGAVEVAQRQILPAPSRAAASDREAARRLAARSMVTEAQLICGAARLVAPGAPGLADTETEANDLAQRIDRVTPAPIDASTRLRARCLSLLTQARRATGNDALAGDTLLSELSASGGLDPSRDERGVVVTLRDAYRGSQLTEAAAAQLKELGRVASAHPAFAVQVVVHDASAAKDASDDVKRGSAAVDALVGGGAKADRVAAELAGARSPVADPAQPSGRLRNERLDVVFVSP